MRIFTLFLYMVINISRVTSKVWFRRYKLSRKSKNSRNHESFYPWKFLPIKYAVDVIKAYLSFNEKSHYRNFRSCSVIHWFSDIPFFQEFFIIFLFSGSFELSYFKIFLNQSELIYILIKVITGPTIEKEFEFWLKVISVIFNSEYFWTFSKFGLESNLTFFN